MVNFSAKWLDWLAPAHCLLCSSAIRHSSTTQSSSALSVPNLCAPCAGSLPRNVLACQRCALPLNSPSQWCAPCALAPFPVVVHAPLRYDHPVDALIQQLKFSRQLRAAHSLAHHWRELEHAAYDMLVPVPLHAQRLRERGFNQAERLARLASRQHDLPLATRVLQRTRATAPQTLNHDATQRRKNLQGAFVVPPRARARIVQKHILLVDDVVTTGSTVREAAQTLLAAGAAQVTVWAVARTARLY